VILLKRCLSSIILSFILIISFCPVTVAAEAEPIRIAVIDTGISADAIDQKNIDEGYNYILSNTSTGDTIGHGTAVAAIIAGSGTAGVTGLCSDAVLVPLVYYSKSDDNNAVKGDLPMLAQIIRDAVDVYSSDIINISSGAKVDTPDIRDALA